MFLLRGCDTHAMSRFKRVVIEMEIEITDDVELTSFVLSTSTDADGEMGLYDYGDIDRKVVAAVSEITSSALQARGRDAGFRWMSGHVQVRSNVDGVHGAITFPEMLARRDDGTYPDED